MSLDPTHVGTAIRARRIAAGLTQAALAERLSVSAQAVSCWERSETLPDISLLPDLAVILDCSVDATDVRRHIRNDKARAYTLQRMQSQGIK